MPRDGQYPCFKFYPDDFAGDRNVEAMSAAEVGAYILLLCKAWREDIPGTIPDDDRLLARWARMTTKEWQSARDNVLRPFELKDDGLYHQARMELEHAKLVESSDKARENVKQRWSKGKENKKYGGNTDVIPNAYYSGSSTDSGSNNKGSSEVPREAGISSLQVIIGEWNMLGDPFPKCLRLTESRKKALRARLADPAWMEDWRRALDRLKAAKFARGDNRRKWVADIDFFLRPDSVIKILEGKYDNGESPLENPQRGSRAGKPASGPGQVYDPDATAKIPTIGGF